MIGEVLCAGAELCFLRRAIGAPESAVKSGTGLRDAFCERVVFARRRWKSLHVNKNRERGRYAEKYPNENMRAANFALHLRLMFGNFFGCIF